uniref:hypothetical chloroplast RF1 n=1 Tax=Nitella hyalina TaxID=181804 RepID=UPI00286D644B|nr:hypothetical chloroplast RF1 [Nitella hyalina]WKT08410.1 hypothetical chloroplast RF1 [Nitella hyalina]
MIPMYPAQPMICLGILYGFLTVFCVTPSQIICARAFLIKGDSLGLIALIGSLVGQLFLFFLILSPIGIIWNRCYFGFVLTSLWFLLRSKKEFQLRSFNYESASKPLINYKLIIFIDSFIFQLLNPITLPNSICYRIITPILFRYSTHLSFVISLTIGWILSNCIFVQITRNLRNRIEYDSIKTYQYIVPSLNNIFINFLWSIIFLSLFRFTWEVYQDTWIYKDGWFHPLRLNKLRIKTRTSQYFLNNIFLPDQNNRLFIRYLPKWSNLIDQIDDYLSIKKPILLNGNKNNLVKNVQKDQLASVMTKLPIMKNNNSSLSWQISKLNKEKSLRRDFSLLREKRCFNYVGYIQKWLSNNWNKRITKNYFFPFPWEPLSSNEYNEALLLLNRFNDKSLQGFINPKLRSQLLKYKDHRTQNLPGTPLVSPKDNEKFQKWQEHLESLPIKMGIRKLQSLRFYIQRNRNKDFKKNLNFIQLQSNFKQETTLNSLLKRKISISKIEEQFESLFIRKVLSRYNKEPIKLKKRNKRPKGTLKAQLRKKNENKRFIPFRYSYMFQVTKFRDNLIKKQYNQASQDISSVIVLSDQEKRWLTSAERSLYIRDLRKQQLKKQRDIAYKKSPFRWLANFVYTSNLLLFLKLRKPLILVKVAFKGIICFFLQKDFSFKEEIKNLNNYIYLIYDIEGNLMPSGKLPEWWFIHGFTIKRKSKEEQTANFQKKMQIEQKKETEKNLVNSISNGKSRIDNRNDSIIKQNSEIKSNHIGLKKKLKTFSFQPKNVNNINDNIISPDNKQSIWIYKLKNLAICSLARVILYLKLQKIKFHQIFFSFFINWTKNFHTFIIDFRLPFLQRTKNQNIYSRKKILFSKSLFSPVQRTITLNSFFLLKRVQLKEKKIFLFNKLSWIYNYIWNSFLNSIFYLPENSINGILIQFYNKIFTSNDFALKKTFLISFSYIDLLERMSRSGLIFKFNDYLSEQRLFKKGIVKKNYDKNQKNHPLFFQIIEKNKTSSKILLRDLEKCNKLVSNLKKDFSYQKYNFDFLLRDYLETLLSKKYLKFSTNKYNIGLINLISRKKKDNFFLPKQSQLKKFLKKVQLKNTTYYLNQWLTQYKTNQITIVNKNTQEKRERILFKTYNIKRKKIIEEFLSYLYCSLFHTKGDLKKFFSNLINFDLNENIPNLIRKNEIKNNQLSFFLFWKKRLEPFDYNILIKKTVNYEKIQDPLLINTKENNESFTTTLQKSPEVLNDLPNYLNYINGFRSDSYLNRKDSSNLSNFTLKKKTENWKVVKGLDNESLQYIQIYRKLACQVFSFLILDENSNFYYYNSPNLMLNSVCSNNQSYHIWRRHKSIVRKIKQLNRNDIFSLFYNFRNYNLLYDYQIENLVCMERIWFSNGQKYSPRRIFIDPWIPIKYKTIQNFLPIDQEPFFLL